MLNAKTILIGSNVIQDWRSKEL